MKNPKIVAAFAVGCAFVLLALVFSDFGQRRKPVGNADGVRVAKAPERSHIPVADTDGDGIPDWQDLIVPEASENTFALAETGDYTEPDTLTGQASVEFMKQLLEVKSGNSLATSEEAFVEQFATNVLKSSDDIKVTTRELTVTETNDAVSLRTYTNGMAQIFISEGFIASAGNELTILSEAVETNNASKLTELAVISGQLTKSIERAKALPVPSAMTTEHINIINTATSLRNDILGMEKLFTDPMYAFVRIRRYEQDTENITQAFYNLKAKATELGARFESNDPINFQ
jgi:hypothetical protein